MKGIPQQAGARKRGVGAVAIACALLVVCLPLRSGAEDDNKTVTKLSCENAAKTKCQTDFEKAIEEADAELVATKTKIQTWTHVGPEEKVSAEKDAEGLFEQKKKTAQQQQSECKTNALAECRDADTRHAFQKKMDERKDNVKIGEGDCKNSDELMGNGGCGLTNTVRDVGKGVSMGADMVGSIAVSMTGSQQNNQLSQQQMSGNSVMQESMKGAAKTYEEAAKVETISAVTNFAAAAALGARTTQHYLNKGQLTKQQLKERDQNKLIGKQQSQNFAMYNHAKKEQDAKAGESLVETAGFIAKAGQKLTAAGLYRNQAANLRKIAGSMYDPLAEATVTPVVDPAPTPTIPTFGWATSTPSVETNEQAASDDSGDLAADLGAPFNPDTDAGDVKGPEAAPFQAGGPPPGGVGGGSGAPGVGGGMGAGAKDEEGSARLADGGKSITYGQPGGTYVTGNRGGGNSPAPDLSGLLAQFLPKEEDKKNQNGILDFGGRQPSAAGEGSLLGPKENIFKRVSEQYQLQHKKKKVGI